MPGQKNSLTGDGQGVSSAFPRLTEQAEEFIFLPMRELDQKQLGALLGTSIRDIDNWLARLPLSTEFEPSGRGRPRQFSRANALELSLVAAQMRAGIESYVAATNAAKLTAEIIKRGKRVLPIVVFNPATGDMTEVGPTATTATVFQLARGTFGGWKGEPIRGVGVTLVALVDLNEIVRRIDAAFTGDGE